MLDRGVDQAQGLRRMFAPGRPRVIQIVAGSGGVGRTAVAVNLAVALARMGRDTLLVEAANRVSEARALGCLGLDITATSRAGGALEAPGVDGLAVWPLALERYAGSAEPVVPIPARLPGRTRLPDWLLINSASGRSLLWTGEQQAHEVLVVLSRAPASITDAYALVKRMSMRALQSRFNVVVNRVVSEAEARLVFRNLASVAHGYLDVRLQYSGFVPADAALARACAEGCNVLDLEPDAPATRAFRRLAQAMAQAAARPGAGSAATASIRAAASL